MNPSSYSPNNNLELLDENLRFLYDILFDPNFFLPQTSGISVPRGENISFPEANIDNATDSFPLQNNVSISHNDDPSPQLTIHPPSYENSTYPQEAYNYSDAPQMTVHPPSDENSTYPQVLPRIQNESFLPSNMPHSVDASQNFPSTSHTNLQNHSQLLNPNTANSSFRLHDGSAFRAAQHPSHQEAYNYSDAPQITLHPPSHENSTYFPNLFQTENESSLPSNSIQNYPPASFYDSQNIPPNSNAATLSLRSDRGNVGHHFIPNYSIPSQPSLPNNHANSNISSNEVPQANSGTNLMSYLLVYDLAPRKLKEEDNISYTRQTVGNTTIINCPISINKDNDTSIIKYSWTDIGQIREWESFNLEELINIDTLQSKLHDHFENWELQTPLISYDPSDHNGEYFTEKINRALSLFPSTEALRMQVHRDEKTNEEIFLTSCMINNSPYEKEDRVVGLREDLYGWDLIWGKNAPILKQKQHYLRALAQLHYYLREYGCRYGYILTDVNLVVVRLGVEQNPSFGFLETKIFTLNPSRWPSLAANGEISEFLSRRMMIGQVQEGPALLALWCLHMLASNLTILGHPSWKIDKKSYFDRSRHRFLARDADLPVIFKINIRRAKRRRRWNTPWEVPPPR
ncbi:hypothetical protein EPUL_006024 [Erysiphe pulchra]|uniref:Uncharacterized protein n=1 Tax=Erysiphe pulchra TaxID=225359 RepID=A0A2S4PRZ5_9PEZI|nr:hypothetical protein EPUL_006024 [Erysiphe pulchra]